jgi:hypothetical protein
MAIASESLRTFLDGFRLWFEDLWHSITG